MKKLFVMALVFASFQSFAGTLSVMKDGESRGRAEITGIFIGSDSINIATAGGLNCLVPVDAIKGQMSMVELATMAMRDDSQITCILDNKINGVNSYNQASAIGISIHETLKK